MNPILLSFLPPQETLMKQGRHINVFPNPFIDYISTYCPGVATFQFVIWRVGNYWRENWIGESIILILETKYPISCICCPFVIKKDHSQNFES